MSSYIQNAQRLLDSAFECAREAQRAATLAFLDGETDEARETLAHITRTLADLEKLKVQLQSVWAS